MSIRSKGFIAAMEDEEVVVAPEDGLEVPVEVADAVVETTDEGEDIVGDVEAMEDAIEDAETLDDIADVAEASAEEGEGMDPVAAEITEVAVESIYARLGLTQKAMPAMESFGSAGSRKAATRIAAEGWKESVKKAWEAVVKFFKNIIERVSAFLAKFFDANLRVEKAAKAMLKRVQDLKGAPEGEIKNGALKGFAVGGGAMSAAKVAGVLETQNALTQATYGVTHEIVKQTNNIANATNGLEGMNKIVKTAFSDFYGKELHDGVKVEIQEKKEGSGVFSSALDFVRKSIAEGSEVSMKTPGKSELEDIVKAVIVLCETNGNYKKIQKDLTDVLKNTMKTADSIGSMVKTAAVGANGEEFTDDKKEILKKARAGVMAAGTFMTKLTAKLPSMNVAASKAALSVVSAAAGKYKEAGAAA